MRFSVWVLGGLLVLSVSACGGDSGPDGGNDGTQPSASSGDRTLDVCGLVSTSEAEAWLGGPGVEAGLAEGPTGPYPEGCTYKNADESAQILLQVYDGEKYFGGPDHELYPDSVIVPNLGEVGFTAGSSAHFLQNDWSVSVSSIAGGIPDEDLVAMAQLVSANLP